VLQVLCCNSHKSYQKKTSSEGTTQVIDSPDNTLEIYRLYKFANVDNCPVDNLTIAVWITTDQYQDKI